MKYVLELVFLQLPMTHTERLPSGWQNRAIRTGTDGLKTTTTQKMAAETENVQYMDLLCNKWTNCTNGGLV